MPTTCGSGLSAVGLEGFCKTTFKGLHVVASLLYGARDNVQFIPTMRDALP